MKRSVLFCLGLFVLSSLLFGCEREKPDSGKEFLSKAEQIEKIKADPNLSQDAKDAAVMALEN